MAEQWANMQDLGASLATRLKAVKEEPDFETCGFSNRAESWKKQEEETQRHLAAQKRAEEIKRLGGILAYEDYTKERFENKKILDAMKGFPEENYFLWGPAGTGKTHAATAILRDVPNAQVMRMSRISRWLRRCEGPDDEIDVIKQLAELTMLIDDLGSEKMTEFLQSNFFEIIDRRVQYRINGLIITSNLSLDQLVPIVGDRTVSRIMGLVGRKNMLEFSGKDYRWERN